jgi:hypothetical protein
MPSDTESLGDAGTAHVSQHIADTIVRYLEARTTTVGHDSYVHT